MSELFPLAGCGLMIIGFGVLFSFWYRAISSLDNLIKYEYENFPEQWEKDRQPHGLFWKPPQKQVKLINRIFQSNPLLKFIFTTPEWMRENIISMEYLNKFRKFVFLWNFSILIGVLLFIIVCQIE